MRHAWLALLLVSCGGNTPSSTFQSDAAVDTANDTAVDSAAAISAACAARAREVCRGFGSCSDLFQQMWYVDKDACAAGEQRICERDITVPGVVDALGQVEACTKDLASIPACPRGLAFLFCAKARPRGTLPDGTSCMYDEQCEGGICAGFGPASLDFPKCGHCARRPQEGDPCSDKKDECSLASTTLRDAGDLTCDKVAGKCVARLPLGASCSFADACSFGTCTDGKCVVPPTGGMEIKLLPKGAACEGFTEVCSGGQFCKRTSTTEAGVCTDPYSGGERCYGPSQCGHVNRCATVPGEALSRCTDARPACAG